MGHALSCIVDVEQAGQIVDLAGGGPNKFVEEGSKHDPRDMTKLRETLSDFLSSGGREIIPPQDKGLQSYAEGLVQSLELRTRFLEYAILRSASCLYNSG